MTASNDSASPQVGAGQDLSALAWVHGELRRSLEAAHKALRRYLKEAEAVRGSDVDAVDPAVLRNARTQLHQGVGALELVGLSAVADVLRASEAAVQRMLTRPAIVDAAAVDTIEHASFALLDFLARQLAGKPVSPVMLFPQYRAVLTLAGADRVHPADLWKIDWQWRELPPDPSARARAADDAARGEMEMLVLSLMRLPAHDSGATLHARMSDLCAAIGAGARDAEPPIPNAATFWQLAAAVFEAQAAALLSTDLYSKRIASRLMAQLRQRLRGENEISDRLAQDLLFFCSHAVEPGPEHPAPRLAAVRRAWNLSQLPTADYETPRLGRFDPALLALARKRVAAARDSWSAVAGAELHRLTGLPEQFALVGESLQRLFPQGEVLARSLQTAAQQTADSQDEPAPALAMEVATAILYLDASLEDGEFDHPELAERVQRLARRIDDVREGAEPQALDGWMEELYRRVSDRQTMGSVVQELRASLSEVEKQIDQYFRDPSQRQLLIPVPAQLSAMRGVLSVLGMEQAAHAVVHMRDDVDALAQTEVDPQRAILAGTFDRLADNLGALSFLIDMLSVQPQLAKSLFRYDPATGNLSAVMGQRERVSAFAAFDEPLAESASSELSLLDQLQALAAAATGSTLSDDALAQRLEPLIAQARGADQRDLLRLLSDARDALGSTPPDAALSDPDLSDASQTARAALQDQLARAIAMLAPPPPPELPTPAPLPPAAPPPRRGDTGLEDDVEMREIFIEEAREVAADARAALERLDQDGDNANEMTVLRRAFHTLKGSSRMVGLRDFGEAGWACEQLFNARLAQVEAMDPALRLLTSEALAYLSDWTEAIADGVDRGHQSADVAQAADALRLQGQRVPIVLPGALPGTAPERLPEPAGADAANAAPADLEAAFELDFDLDQPLHAIPDAAVAPPSAVEATQPLPTPRSPEGMPSGVAALDFDFDLDLPGGAPAAAEPPQEPPHEPLQEPSQAPPHESLPEPERWPDETPTLVLTTLTERVPDLPSAADLDLGPPDAAAAPSLDFEFDLSEFDEAPAEAPAEAQVSSDVVAAPVADSGAHSREPTVAGSDTSDAEPMPTPEVEALEMDFGDFDPMFAERAAADALPQPPADETSAPAPVGESIEPLVEVRDDEQIKLIGPLRISIPLFNIFLNEADELSRRLGIELAEWAIESERHPVPESSAALAHSLAGNSATVGYLELSALARSLEHALMRSHRQGAGRDGEPELFTDAAEEIRRLLHQFAAGFLRNVPPELTQRLAEHERWPGLARDEGPVDSAPGTLAGNLTHAPAPAAAAANSHSPAADEGIDAVDSIDAELFPIFEEEADELLPQLQSRLREWRRHPADSGAPMACMRTLHTIKGGARLAGALRLGEMAHRLETAIESIGERGDAQTADIDALLLRADEMNAALDGLRRARAPQPQPQPQPLAPAAAVEVEVESEVESRSEAENQTDADAAPAFDSGSDSGSVSDSDADSDDVQASDARSTQAADGDALVADERSTSESDSPAPAAGDAVADASPETAQPAAPEPVAIDWSRFDDVAAADDPAAGVERGAGAAAVVRVRAGLLDRMVNQAGEVSIARARISGNVKQLQGSLNELTDSLDRMRRQLRDLELQAETQITSRMEAAKAASTVFDPLEMDRFTRFQELTRFMAESVNDVATLQRSLQRALQSAEDELAAQARLTRELQDDLLRTRMVEFESLSDRLFRTARQAARDTGKQVQLEIEGGAIEIDRGVLERMVGSFEHLLRNSVAHGIEAPDVRVAGGKDASGRITIGVSQAGNEVAVEFADDGAGIDRDRIRRRAVERGLLDDGASIGDDALVQMIFQPGFSTAESVTELAGRGVGLDVVRAEVNAMGGRIETVSASGQGTRFRLLLPLTTAVTQVVMLRCGAMQVAVPSTLIEVVRRVGGDAIDSAYQQGSIDVDGQPLPFYWLAALLSSAGRGGNDDARSQTVVIIRSAAQRVAVHVDEVVGNQEVVVKNVGPQLSRLPGLAGVTLLPSGAVALIYNPVALASLYGDAARERMRQGADQSEPTAELPQRAALVLVVDDSLTVRRVTQRLLVREGYRVVTAKDGIEALERLAEERPAVLLSDIEMPRMDGFDLVRHVRADPLLADLPVVMITSRIAAKHRDYAAELGVDHYLGKPYAEEELLGLVARYAGADIPA